MAKPTPDQRVEALRGLVMNLREHPADQSEQVLADCSVLGAELKGLADLERLTRALHLREADCG
ncbi:hypothetical protein K1W54_29845 [Micromonospora sp. CPCC 205371]|nr:hypothetical protein [Micromonospora sp. CPCC 205371]